MPTRTIQSPGVFVVEKDFSQYAANTAGTTVFVTGFADNGPVDEVVQVTSQADFTAIYGVPKTPAERYFYHTVDQLLKSPANVLVNRLPYGSGSGVGFGSYYSALVYPTSALQASTGQFTNNLDLSAATYFLGRPYHIDLTQAQYEQLQSGITWSSTGGTSFTKFTDLSSAAVIVLNKAATTIDAQYRGYYVGISDNFNLNPATNYDCFITAETVNASTTTGANDYVTIPQAKLTVSLSALSGIGSATSLSYVQENIPTYDVSTTTYDDTLTVGVYKTRTSLFATDPLVLDSFLEEGYFGSIDFYRKTLNENGGTANSLFLENVDASSRNIQVMVNPYISNKFTDSSISSNNVPLKKVRVLTQALKNSATSAALSATVSGSYWSGTANALQTTLATIGTNIGYADSVFAVGAFSNTQFLQKNLGSIPDKLDRTLSLIANDAVYEIDIVVEAGLGTIWSAAQTSGVTYYDDVAPGATYISSIDALRTGSDITNVGNTARSNYLTIFNKFANFASPSYIGGGRGDLMFIPDVLRHILVVGENTKVVGQSTKNFTTDIYWPMRHQFETVANNIGTYLAAYANWGKVYDGASGTDVWIPFSGTAAATYARSEAVSYPWYAPAGFNRGGVTTITDIAINPTQKQRDELYKVSLNPVAFFPQGGIIIHGQKTLAKVPSAFDRVNVRRLFLNLERITKKLCNVFVFEPNTEFTRTRLTNTLTPVFERCLNTDGVYSYRIICSKLNNPPQVIDNNELVVDIYLQPVKAAEFIIVNFIANRSGTNFQEFINGNQLLG